MEKKEKMEKIAFRTVHLWLNKMVGHLAVGAEDERSKELLSKILKMKIDSVQKQIRFLQIGLDFHASGPLSKKGRRVRAELEDEMELLKVMSKMYESKLSSLLTFGLIKFILGDVPLSSVERRGAAMLEWSK